MKKRGILLDIDYKIDSNSREIETRLFIKTDKGIEFFSDKKYKPYLYLLTTDSVKVKKLVEEKEFVDGDGVKFKSLKVEEVKRNNAEKVLQIFFRNTRELVGARDILKNLEGVIDMREYDIPFVKRYLIDNALEPTNLVELELNEKGEIEKSKSLEVKDVLKQLNICSFDLETYSPGRFSDPKLDHILTIGFADNNESTVLTTKKVKLKGVETFDSEADMINAFVRKIKGNKVDGIATYNGDRFDFPYLKERCNQLKIKFPIGADDSEPILKKTGLDNSVQVKGLPHFDVYQIMRFLARIGAVNLLKFDLESVVERIFGVSKEKLQVEDMMKIWETGKDFERLVNYNREDTEYTLKLATEYLPMIFEMAKLVKETPFEVNRSSTGQLVEYLLINKSFETNNLIPNRPSEAEVRQRLLQPIKGGYVKEPVSGLHENIAVLDFRSLHPSIMISHNITPEKLNCKCCQSKPKNLSPDGDWFCDKETGFMSGILEEILNKRMEAKKLMKGFDKKSLEYKSLHAKQHSLKILLNSFYGSLGYARFRWYNRNCARAVTAWSRYYIQEVAEKAEKTGLISIYGDSVTKDRQLVLKNPEGRIEIQGIEKFFNEIDRLPHERGTKEFKPVEGYETLSVNPETFESEWKPIKEVIRHKTNKKIYRVNQKFGETRVTEDHSIIIKENGKLVETKAVELNNRKLFSANIPKEENFIEIIDLYEELKNYHFDILYKDRIKINQCHKEDKFITFGWMDKKEEVKLKRFIEVGSPEFESMCRLLGAYIAEGSSSTPETTNSRIGASIASSDKEWLSGLKQDYENLFANTTTSIIRSTQHERVLTYKNNNVSKTVQYTDETMKLQLMNQLTAVFFKVFCGQKSVGKKLPNFIFNVSDKYKRLLLEKMIEGDGSRTVNKKLGYTEEYIRKNFRYTTKSLKVASGLSVLLKQLEQKHTIYYRQSKQAYSIGTCDKHNERIETKITEEKYADFVYDLSVEDNNNFVDACGQILLHNTDSIFLLVPKGKTEKDVIDFMNQVNSELPGNMELEYEGFFKRGLFVTKKEGGAAKKKYALIDFNGEMKIVGFEYVRRDWSKIAKETQREVIKAVLEEGNPEKAIKIAKEKIKYLKDGKAKKKDLIVMTVLKRSVESYEAIGPHVSAAKKAIERGKKIDVGSILEYIITRNGKSISDKAELEEYVNEGNYDSEYYIENQVIPAVLKIVREFDCDKEDLLQEGKQSNLASFM